MRTVLAGGDISDGGSHHRRPSSDAEVYAMMWGWEAGGGWLMMGIGMLIWLALIGLVVWLVIRAVGQRSGMGGSESAEELLRRRYAAGEIDAEDYQTRLETLRRR